MLCCNLLLCGSAGSFLSGCLCPHVGFGGTEELDWATVQTTPLLGKVYAGVLHSGIFKLPRFSWRCHQNDNNLFNHQHVCYNFFPSLSLYDVTRMKMSWWFGYDHYLWKVVVLRNGTIAELVNGQVLHIVNYLQHLGVYKPIKDHFTQFFFSHFIGNCLHFEVTLTWEMIHISFLLCSFN